MHVVSLALLRDSRRSWSHLAGRRNIAVPRSRISRLKMMLRSYPRRRGWPNFLPGSTVLLMQEPAPKRCLTGRRDPPSSQVMQVDGKFQAQRDLACLSIVTAKRSLQMLARLRPGEIASINVCVRGVAKAIRSYYSRHDLVDPANHVALACRSFRSSAPRVALCALPVVSIYRRAKVASTELGSALVEGAS
jgi:hypothetical protein